MRSWDGGRHLTSEAEWEYAASGRGEERIYPWGNERPDCDRVIFARKDVPNAVVGESTECSRPATTSSSPGCICHGVTEMELNAPVSAILGLVVANSSAT